MIRRPPRSTRTDTLFPYTTLFRSNPEASAAFPNFDKGMKNDCADLRSRHLRMPPEHRVSFERRHAPSHSQRRGNLASQFRPPRDDRRLTFEHPIIATGNGPDRKSAAQVKLVAIRVAPGARRTDTKT